MSGPRKHGPNFFRAVQLRTQGLSVPRIARTLGISETRVRRILKASGLTGKGGGR